MTVLPTAEAHHEPSTQQQRVIEVEAHLIAKFRDDVFQDRLRSTWKTGTRKAVKRALCQGLYAEVKEPAAAFFGFQSVEAMEAALQQVDRSPEMWLSADLLEWLLDPDMQAESGIRSQDDLLCKGGWWVVIGGQPAGGLLVRRSQELSSPAFRSRLCTGSRLQATERVTGNRLHYALVSGDGPDCGWVSLDAGGKVLVMPDLEGYVRPDLPPRRWSHVDQRIPQRKRSPAKKALAPPRKLSPVELKRRPAWAHSSAEKLEARRAGQLVKPDDAPRPPRLQGDGCCQRLPPHVALSRKELEAVASENRPGFWSQKAFPHSPEQIVDFGPAWLTQAFRAFGTLPEDNAVARIVRVERLPEDGVDRAGGAATKAFITVEYAKKDPSLHEELFAKMPYEMTESSPQLTKDTRHRVSCVYGDADGSELSTYVFCEHLFPFKVPRLYFCDISRESTNYILITERVKYAPGGKLKNGKIVGKGTSRPWQVLPVCKKKMDYLMDDIVSVYGCCMRAMGQLAAWDHLGRFDEFLGPKVHYTPEQFLESTGKRKALPAKRRQGYQNGAAALLDKGIWFATEVAPQLFSKRAADPDMLELMKEELVPMAPHFPDFQYYVGNDSRYVAAMHPNLQPDNAYFWPDELGDLDCGVLDWCNFARTPFVGCFLGCLVGMDAELLDEQEENMIRIFAKEHRRYGGPELSCEEMRMRLHLHFVRMLVDNCQWVEKELIPDLPVDVWKSIENRYDERFIACWSARTRGSNIINAFEFWNRRPFKEIFETWKAGVGAAYLTHFAEE